MKTQNKFWVKKGKLLLCKHTHLQVPSSIKIVLKAINSKYELGKNKTKKQRNPGKNRSETVKNEANHSKIC